MKKYERTAVGVSLALALLGMVSGVSARQSVAPSSDQVSVVRSALPAVVGIGVLKGSLSGYGFGGNDVTEDLKQYYNGESKAFRDRAKPQWNHKADPTPTDDIQCIGTGFLIDGRGLVVTAFHVVEGATQAFVIMADGSVYRTRTSRSSQEDDLAVLEIENAKTTFPALTLGDSDSTDIAEPVFAIGNPFGLQSTVTSGIVSAKNRSLENDSVEGLIQTDASINPGNSGGPIINKRGEVIGVGHAILTPQGGSVGIGFAIPVNRVKALLASTSGTAGVNLGLGVVAGERGGVAILSVESQSTAENAGLRRGDTIVSLDGKPVRNPGDLRKLLNGRKPGDVVLLGVLRKGQEISVKLTLGSR